jgi:hypothetical protein
VRFSSCVWYITNEYLWLCVSYRNKCKTKLIVDSDSSTVLLRNNLTLRSRSKCFPNAVGTRSERGRNAVGTRLERVPEETWKCVLTLIKKQNVKVTLINTREIAMISDAVRFRYEGNRNAERRWKQTTHQGRIQTGLTGLYKPVRFSKERESIY